MTIEQEIQEAIKRIMPIGNLYYQHRQRVAALGGAYFAAAAESAAPKSAKPHKRYNTAKLSKKIRAPKGRGTVAATYYPGNLGRSINVLKFSRAKSKVFVGAKLSRRSSGNFSGQRTDGYYMHMVEQGTKHSAATPFFRSTWERTRPRVLDIMLKEFQRIGREFERKNAIR